MRARNRAHRFARTVLRASHRSACITHRTTRSAPRATRSAPREPLRRTAAAGVCRRAPCGCACGEMSAIELGWEREHCHLSPLPPTYLRLPPPLGRVGWRKEFPAVPGPLQLAGLARQPPAHSATAAEVAAAGGLAGGTVARGCRPDPRLWPGLHIYIYGVDCRCKGPENLCFNSGRRLWLWTE